MTLFLVSFLAGMLTVMAPCILPVLPIILGGSLVGEQKPASIARPLRIVGSLAVSVVVFTLLLKASTALLGVSTVVWSSISGLLVIGLGITLIVPNLWEALSIKLGLSSGANKLLASTGTQKGIAKDVLTGMALGPVFSSCSPTYALIVAVVLPQSFGQGLLYLMSYAVGLALALLFLTLIGQKIIQRLAGTVRPGGTFNKVLGLLFVLVGLGLLFGLDKDLQTFILDNGWYAPISNFENSLK